MTTLNFTSHLQRHISTPSANLKGDTVRQILEAYFQSYPRVRSYILDDQGAVRKHVAIFINHVLVKDRDKLSDPVCDDDQILVVQALSGG